DQIVFTVPDNVPTGCAVPLAVQITSGNVQQISNNVLVAVAGKGSRDCTPIDPTLKALDPSLVQQAFANKTILVGIIELDHFLNDNNNGFVDRGQANLLKATGTPIPAAFAITYLDHPALGTCLAQPQFGGGANLGDFTPLDAGTSVTVKGPN